MPPQSSKPSLATAVAPSSKKTQLDEAKRRSAVKRLENDMDKEFKAASTTTAMEREQKLSKNYNKLKHVYKNESWLVHVKKYIASKVEYDLKHNKTTETSGNKPKNNDAGGGQPTDNTVIPDAVEILLKIAPFYATNNLSRDEYILIHREIRAEEEQINAAKAQFELMLQQERNDLYEQTKLKLKRGVVASQPNDDDGDPNPTLNKEERKKKLRKRKRNLARIQTIGVHRIAQHLSVLHPEVAQDHIHQRTQMGSSNKRGEHVLDFALFWDKTRHWQSMSTVEHRLLHCFFTSYLIDRNAQLYSKQLLCWMRDLHGWAQTSSCLSIDITTTDDDGNHTHEGHHQDDGPTQPPTIEMAQDLIQTVQRDAFTTAGEPTEGGLSFDALQHWIDHFITQSPAEQRHEAKQSTFRAHAVSFAKRLVKYLQCTKATGLPTMNYSNVKDYFVAYSQVGTAVKGTGKGAGKGADKAHRVLTPDGLLRWMWDVRPVQYADYSTVGMGTTHNIDNIDNIDDINNINNIDHNTNTSGTTIDTNNTANTGLPLPPPTRSMATDIVRKFFLVPSSEQGIHMDEFLFWINGTSGAFMSVKGEIATRLNVLLWYVMVAIASMF
jgi:hypothetical protein